jgi:hypothetical protein
MRRADPGLLDEVRRVRDLGHVERLEQAVIDVEPADMGGREGHIALGRVLGELGLVEPVDGTAGDVLDLGAGLRLELRGDGLVDQIAEAAAPGADDELLGRLHRDDGCDQGGGREERGQKTHHVDSSFLCSTARRANRMPEMYFILEKLFRFRSRFAPSERGLDFRSFHADRSSKRPLPETAARTIGAYPGHVSPDAGAASASSFCVTPAQDVLPTSRGELFVLNPSRSR